MVKKSKKEEKKSKKIKTKSAKIKESKQEKKKKQAARRRLHFMAINYDSEKTKTTFSEYLEKKREKEEKINQLVIEAKLDSDSVASLTNFLEDNDFSEKDSSDEDEEFEINDKKDKNKKSSKKEEKFDINKPLQGKIIVLSGEMLIPKEYLKVILLNLGAKVTTAISNKTDILIHGETLEDGRKYNLGRKYKMAKAKKVKIYLDRDFETYMTQLINKDWKMRNEAKKVKF